MLRLDINLLFTIANILIWFFLIKKFLFKPINDTISKREEMIMARYDEAARLQEEANQQRDKYIASCANIEDERTRVMAQAQEEAHAEYEHILGDARKKAIKIVLDSQKEAEIEKEKILSKADNQIRGMLLDAAKEIMKSSDNDSELYDQFLTKAGDSTDA